MSEWPAEGIYPGISPTVYFASPKDGEPRIASKSLLWDFYPNPYRWKVSPPKVVTDSMRWGSLVDCLALTPERFDAGYKLQPDTYVSAPADCVLTTDFPGEWNGRQKVCREWKAEKEAAGLMVMTPEEHAKASEPKPWNWNSTTCQEWRKGIPSNVEIISSDTLRQARVAVANLNRREEFAEMMDGARCQVGMRYDAPELLHEQPGMIVPIKGLIDIVPDGSGKWGDCLCDLKTTGKLDDLRQIERTIYDFGYHAQAALYLDCWNVLTGEDRTRFVFIFQQSAEPFEVAIVELDSKALEAGRAWYLRAIRKWAACVAKDQWPSPWDGLQVAGIPGWAEKKEEAAQFQTQFGRDAA